MKILGEKSLSSKVIIGLNILFAIISFIDVFVLTLIVKSIRDVIINVNLQENTFNLNLFSMIIVTGIIALFIIYQFIKIFENLKKSLLSVVLGQDNAVDMICKAYKKKNYSA